VTQYLW